MLKDYSMVMNYHLKKADAERLFNGDELALDKADAGKLLDEDELTFDEADDE